MVNLFSATKTVTTDVLDDQIVLSRSVFRNDIVPVTNHFIDFQPFPNFVLLAELIFPIPQFAGRILVNLTIQLETDFDSFTIRLPAAGGTTLRFQRSDEDGTNTVIIAESPGLKIDIQNVGGSEETHTHTLIIEEDTTVTALVRRYSITIRNQGGINSSPGQNAGPFGFHAKKRKFTVRAELR